MARPVRIALVGLGDIAVRAHLPAILRERRAELVALVEPDPGRREAAAGLVPGVPEPDIPGNENSIRHVLLIFP